MAFILKPVEKDCVCLVSGKRHFAHEVSKMSVFVSGKRQIAHESLMLVPLTSRCEKTLAPGTLAA